MSILHNPYKDDYDHVPEMDKKGRFRDRFFYAGDLYILPFDENLKKKTYLPCVLSFVGMMVAIIVEGCINQTSSRTLWVVLPYMTQFLPALFFLLGIVEYIGATPRMTRQQHDKGIGRMRFCAIALIVLSIISAICEVIYLIINRGDYVVWKELLYLFCHLLPIAASVLFGMYYNKHFSGITVEKNK